MGTTTSPTMALPGPPTLDQIYPLCHHQSHTNQQHSLCHSNSHTMSRRLQMCTVLPCGGKFMPCIPFKNLLLLPPLSGIDALLLAW